MAPPPIPLPPNDYVPEHLRSAYELCLRLEAFGDNWSAVELPSAVLAGLDTIYSPQVCGRLLCQMMRQAPNALGCRNVVGEIRSCERASDPETIKALVELAALNRDRSIRAFGAKKRRLPYTISHPSRLSVDLTDDYALSSPLMKPPNDYQAARKLAMLRDGYRCVTGAYDDGMFDIHSQDPTDDILPDTITNPLHFSYDLNLISTGVLEYRFGDVEALREECNIGEGIHSMSNAMMLTGDIRTRFDSLAFWPEQTDTPNTYRVRVASPRTLAIYGILDGHKITLTTPTPELPLPDERLRLALHATCAKVADFSGAAEGELEIARDIEELDVLAYDGGSAHVLAAALRDVYSASPPVPSELPATETAP
ncbi:hypothetical protein BV25DRAFT_1920716 [Artomyces pyxidatus]|uniref:Uncharacterized protein n=1 Tax=Artomyces pyxidatus TaxID=48021 RepID=A0ACB8SJU0_9AGAM|nr:hypothetical protein BV25DRAFT_1920716 [Artomyces pyxidatus]